MKYKVGNATIDLNLLAALNALLEEGSVTLAAQRMHLSAPAMSRILSQIREAFDDPILVRSGRRLVTTPRAEQLRVPVQHWVKQAEALFHSPIMLDMASYKGTFTLCANDVFLSTYAPALIQVLQKEAPLAILKCLPEGGGELPSASHGNAELHIGATDSLHPDTKVQTLFDTHFVAVAAASHPIFNEEISAARFAYFPHISVSRRGRLQGPIDAALQRQGLARHIALVAPSFTAALLAIPHTDMIMPLPLHLARSAPLDALGLRSFSIPLLLPPITLQQAWHPRYDNDPAHRWLRQTIKRLCKEE